MVVAMLNDIYTSYDNMHLLWTNTRQLWTQRHENTQQTIVIRICNSLICSYRQNSQKIETQVTWGALCAHVELRAPKTQGAVKNALF